MKKTGEIIALLLLFALILSGCSGPSDSGDPGVPENAEEPKDTLRMVAREINYTFDPTKPQTDGYFRRCGAIEALTYINADGSVTPWLAESVDQIDTNHWDIVLRENAVFWSGKPVTADAVIASLERSASENVGMQAALEGITFEIKTDYLIGATTEMPDFDLPLALEGISIYNAEKDLSCFEEIDFTGMYRIVEHEARQKIVLEINEDYYGVKPKIENVIYEEIPDDDARIALALSGQADIVSGLPVTAAKQIEESNQMDLYISNPSGTLEVYLNHDREAISDVRVRQALNWGTDRQELVDVATEGYGMGVSTWLGSNPLFADKDKHPVYTEYSTEKAAELLDEAGWKVGADGIREKNGKKLTFKLYTWGNEKTMGELLQMQWAKIGVDVDVNHVDWSVIEESWTTGDWDGFIASWNHYGNMYSIISNHYAKDGTFNYSNYRSDEFDAKLEELKNTPDKESKKEIIWEINLLLARDGVRVPMLPRPSVIAVNKHLKGYETHFMTHPNCITNKLEFE